MSDSTTTIVQLAVDYADQIAQTTAVRTIRYICIGLSMVIFVSQSLRVHKDAAARLSRQVNEYTSCIATNAGSFGETLTNDSDPNGWSAALTNFWRYNHPIVTAITTDNLL